MHEMLFGFLSAAIAGFILTAVPNWTGRRGWAGWPLAALFLLWLAGRVLAFPLLAVSLWLNAAVDLLFVPSLLGLVLHSLASAHNRHNYFIALMLGLYWGADLLCWLDPLMDANTWDRGITLGFDGVLLLIVIIGGRVIPSFTSSYLHRLGQEPGIRMNTGLDKLSIIIILGLLVLHQLDASPVLVGIVAGAAALIHIARLLQWHSFRTRHDPLVWILHIAYLWIPIALALHAAQILTHAPFTSAWRHALSVGAFSCMVMGIMSRAALGHTGRPLQASKFMVAGYWALIGAGILRVFVAPLMTGEHYFAALTASGSLWYLAFLLYIIVYAPILIFPRPDVERLSSE